MKFRHITAVAAVAASAFGIMADADAATTYDDLTFTVSVSNPGTQLTSTVAGATTFANSFTFAGYSGSVVTPVATITGGTLSPGGSTNPDYTGGTSNYLAAYNGNSETISFNTKQSYLGLLWGSVDPSNTITFYNGNTQIASYTAQALNSNASLQYYGAPASYVGFTADSGSSDFNRVVLSESATYYETSNYASVSAVPLPGALPLFGSAVLGIGALARRRAKKTV